MGLDKRGGSKPPAMNDRTNTHGSKIDPGPYIGIVKNNVDPTRSGRLQVFIPDLGGVETDRTHWRTVSYASPFFGMTTYPDPKPEQNSYKTVSHTYGMWFVPPDLDNQVLVTFVLGNPSRGYWFACIGPNLSKSMVPAINGAGPLDKTNLDPELRPYLQGDQYPTVEFNENNKTFWKNRDEFTAIAKPIHEDQVRILLDQGLEDDLIRGVITSSVQRESPSAVFGISTPGRDSGNPGDLDAKTKTPKYRLGGHQFVMDDGDINGVDQMIRLRTAGGHQIMLNDSEEIIYIANNNGTVWMEFNSDGQLHIFTDQEFSLRSKLDINLHSDRSINMYAANDIKMYAGQNIREQSQNIFLNATTNLAQIGGKVEIESGSTMGFVAATQGTWKTGELHLSADNNASINGGSQLLFTAGAIHLNGPTAPQAPTVPAIDPIQVSSFVDTQLDGLKWKATGKIQSTVGIVPTHEPWVTQHNVTNGNTAAPDSDVPPIIPVVDTTVATSPGVQAAIGKGVATPAPISTMTNQPPCNTPIGVCTAQQTDALKAQIGFATGKNYNVTSASGAIGKYFADAQTLSAQGYVIPTATNADLASNSSWTGLNGITSADTFMKAVDVQEKVMTNKLAGLSTVLTQQGVLTTAVTPTNTAGVLSVANSVGVPATIDWMKGANTTIAPVAAELFNQGRFAVDILAQAASIVKKAAPATSGAATVTNGQVSPIPPINW